MLVMCEQASGVTLDYDCRVAADIAIPPLDEQRIVGSLSLASCGFSRHGIEIFVPKGQQCDPLEPEAFAGTVQLWERTFPPSTTQRVAAVVIVGRAPTTFNHTAQWRFCTLQFILQTNYPVSSILAQYATRPITDDPDRLDQCHSVYTAVELSASIGTWGGGHDARIDCVTRLEK